MRAVNDLDYVIEYLRTGEFTEAHATRLKFYSDVSLDAKAILSHFVSFETGMQVQRLLHLEDGKDGLIIAILWRGLPSSKDKL